MNQAQQNIALLASGLALGVIAGILLAPQSGRDTREELRQRAVNASSVGRDYLQRIRSRGADDVAEVTEG